ncbi:MAG: 1-deoxy-D-xylulose-5-phosphate synthase [Syntrophomonadaceae bacterium]|jgi:1-deoxy-D-xylulose-5-phosphate synthase|nr:1-deoxy-D-xylulose-5-phosphate synthase [Syntrophomonadaceae bacterium]
MPGILERVKCSEDLKKLTIKEMNVLAAEIRELLITSVSRCGGHLAPNLGVVELSIALHYVFNTAQDRVIWDVGHQSYVHKILTGRKDLMSTLRQYGGLSGFPKSEESIHDAFNTGHSSTSISAALGMAVARDLQEEDYSVVAVIGDGALTGGMAFEALNHAGIEGRDLIVVLNDNEMSISKNVGAMSGYLNRLRTDPSYSRTKEEIEHHLMRIPGIGPNIARAAGKFKDLIKYLMVPGIWFEELGFTYIGPVNGHDLDELLPVLKNARRMKGPIFIHVITEKGRGYEPARQDPGTFHGVGPFDISTGKTFKKAIKTYTEIFGEYMVERARTDSKLVTITAAMANGTGLSEFACCYPERFFDTGICEQHAVTLAAGMAKAGLRPVVAIYSTFLQRAYDQIIHDVALQRLPVIFAIDRAGLVGEDGPTHHGVFDLAYLRSIPELTLMAPSNENELLDMLHTAFTINGPVAIRYPRGAGEGVEISRTRQLLPVGEAHLMKKGQDLAIMAIGRGVSIACQVARLLEQKGISTLLVDARFVKPLDISMITDIGAKYQRLVTIEDNCIKGGFGSAVLEALAETKQQLDVLRIGIPDEFIEHGKVELLFNYLDMDEVSIVESIINKWPELLSYSRELGLLNFGQN